MTQTSPKYEFRFISPSSVRTRDVKRRRRGATLGRWQELSSRGLVLTIGAVIGGTPAP
jgi:hypothetical protein